MLNPINNVVLLKPDNPEKSQRVTDSGRILLPPGSYYGDYCLRCHTGTVLKIGNSVHLVNIGDRIAYTPFSVKKVGDDGLLVIRQDDIMAVVEK